jgi:hypothetical protein
MDDATSHDGTQLAYLGMHVAKDGRKGWNKGEGRWLEAGACGVSIEFHAVAG